MIICIVGYSGCGKSYVAEKLLSQLPSYKHIEMSKVVKALSTAKQTGTDVIGNKGVVQKLFDKMTDDCIITGIRESYIIDQLVAQYKRKNVMIFYLDVPEDERLLRMQLSRQITLSEFCAKDIAERQIGLTQLLLEQKVIQVNSKNPVQQIVSKLESRGIL